MKKYDRSFVEIERYRNNPRKPDFNNLLKVLHKQKPDRPTLFEFFLNPTLYRMLVPDEIAAAADSMTDRRIVMHAFKNAGYDYATMAGSDFGFPTERHKTSGSQTISLNDGAVIRDRESFQAYPWRNPADHDYSHLVKLGEELPEGMKFVVNGPGGVLENVIALVGYEALCLMLADDPGLVQDIFDAVGIRLVQYYEISAGYDSVGALISNDDWGFKTQTMLSAVDMRKYVFPWHQRIAEACHKAGKPVILHSCGNLEQVMEDIIHVIKMDGKHSYEDTILPVEEFYRQWKGKIAVLGGLDVDFLCRSTPEEVYARAVDMIELSADTGGYALGSGNSIPAYIPIESYLAMIAAVNFGSMPE